MPHSELRASARLLVFFVGGFTLAYVLLFSSHNNPVPAQPSPQTQLRATQKFEPNVHPLLQYPPCVVDTCSDDWDSPSQPININFDPLGCATVQHMVKPSEFSATDSKITTHWCKVLLAQKRCADKRYRWMVFRDDDTIFDLRRVFEIAVQRNASLLASYDAPHVKWMVTNWFLLDTHSPKMCEMVDKWWESRKFDYPEHDQKYFNHVFKCGTHGVECFDKFKNLVSEVHCRSSLGYGTKARQSCMRYQIQPRKDLI